MTQCKTLNAKLSNLQLNKLKYGIKRGTEVTLMGNSNDETSFSHKLLLTNIKVSRLCKTCKWFTG